MPAAPTNLTTKLDEISDQFDQLTQKLMDPEIIADHRQVRSLSIKRATIEPIVDEYRAYLDTREQIDQMRSVIADGDDADIVALAREELPVLEENAEAIMIIVQRQLLTADDQAVGSVILEVRAGVGGDEAALWAGDLVQMYQRFAESRRWRVEVIDASVGEKGGFKHFMLNISGEGVWSQLGYEGGTHQVKRVPITETQGRIHTSTATVAVLPEPDEIEVKIDPNDVKEMITTSQGPGGQNVNKVATCVHLIHEPTGVEVRMQDTKSQAQNRIKAWQVLRARLYERQQAQADAERAEARNTMIGRGSRAEKIRTYRFKDNIAVDHRLGGGQSFNLTDLLAGRLDPMVDALIELDTAQRLAAL